MQVLKHGLSANIVVSGKQATIIKLLQSGTKKTDIPKELGVTRQYISLMLSEISSEFFSKIPELNNLCNNFDTYLNLSEHIKDEFIDIIEVLFLMKNKKITTARRRGCLIDKKLSFTTKSPSTVFKYAKELEKGLSNKNKIVEIKRRYYLLQKPVSITSFAKLLNLNVEKLNTFMNKIMKEYFILYDGYIVINTKKHFITFLKNIQKLPYVLSLKEVHNYLLKFYYDDCLTLNIENIHKLFLYIRRNTPFLNDDIIRTKEGYELSAYAKMHGIKEYVYYTSNKAKESSVEIDSINLIHAMRKQGVSEQKLSEKINKSLLTIHHWCDKNFKVKTKKENVERVAKILHVNFEYLKK